MNSFEKEMFGFACELAQSAGEKIVAGRKSMPVEITKKTSQMDIVTQFDILIEKYITNELRQKYPDHSFVGEECHKSGKMADTGYTWILDPIDGTTNFCRFDQDYAISLALYRDSVPVFGFVYDVAGNRMFSAGKNQESLINNCKLANAVNNRHSLDKAVVGMSIRTIRELNNMGTDIIGLLTKVHAHRYLGCASLELCRVATGEYDLFLSSNLYIWDIAAARIIIEQSGGYLYSFAGNTKTGNPDKLFTIAYKSPELWEEMLELLSSEARCAFSGCRF